MRTDALALLKPLWRLALSQPMHSPGCSCAAPAAIHLDPGTLELDLLDYLEDKHGLGEHPAWREALAQRAAAPAQGFPDWLASLRGICVPDELHAQLVDDTAAVLRSMTAHAAGRLAPPASLGRGWLGG
jgi:hypothetical protein